MNGNRLRDIRRDLGLSQESLADALGIGNRQIWRYENGETQPSGDMVAQIARVLGTSSDYLLGLVDDPSPRTLPGELSQRERAALSAWRRGDKLAAIKVIANDE